MSSSSLRQQETFFNVPGKKACQRSVEKESCFVFSATIIIVGLIRVIRIVCSRYVCIMVSKCTAYLISSFFLRRPTFFLLCHMLTYDMLPVYNPTIFTYYKYTFFLGPYF